MQENCILGIDVGASGVKGAIVNVKTGLLVSERIRIPTPSPSTPGNLAIAIKEIVKELEWEGEEVGIGFPSIIKNGELLSAANIDDSCIGVNVEKLFSKVLEKNVTVYNDADAAGLGEYYFGAGAGQEGMILLITVGSGLGSALIVDGQLVPNTEFGHLYFKKHKAEKYASDNTRKKEELSYIQWAKRFNDFLLHMERVLSPDLIIIGGGSSKKFDQYSSAFTVNAKVVPAQLLNNAGIVGAAVYAATKKKTLIV